MPGPKKINPVVKSGNPTKHGTPGWDARYNWRAAARRFNEDPYTPFDPAEFGLGTDAEGELGRRLLAQLIQTSLDEARQREVAPWMFTKVPEEYKGISGAEGALTGIDPKYQW